MTHPFITRTGIVIGGAAIAAAAEATDRGEPSPLPESAPALSLMDRIEDFMGSSPVAPYVGAIACLVGGWAIAKVSYQLARLLT